MPCIVVDVRSRTKEKEAVRTAIMYVAMNHGYELRGKDDRGESLKHILEGGREYPWTEQSGSHQCARVSKCHIERGKEVKNNRDGWAGKIKSDRIPKNGLVDDCNDRDVKPNDSSIVTFYNRAIDQAMSTSYRANRVDNLEVAAVDVKKCSDERKSC